MSTRVLIMTACCTLALILGACQREIGPLTTTPDDPSTQLASDVLVRPVDNPPAPSGQVTVEVGDKSLTFWPYTSNDFNGGPQDPINLIFFGKCDPRQIRAALLSLDGDRSALGLPPVAPFNSRWQDAIGDVQTGYGDSAWTGGVIQLACGEYQPVRFHLRLFTMGDWTVGNAHFEALIPGTADHQVLNWEVAEQFVLGDFMRSGLLDATTPVIPTEQINPSPFRTIPAIIYNGLPGELKGLIGGPLGPVDADVPIGTDGHAMILNLAKAVPVTPDQSVQDFSLTYGQVVPKPFCNNASDFVYVEGPVRLRQVVTITDDLKYIFSFQAEGSLHVTPVNPMNGEPIGQTLDAGVLEKHWGQLSSKSFIVNSSKRQLLTPANAPGAGSFSNAIRISSNGNNGYSLDLRCADEQIALRLNSLHTDPTKTGPPRKRPLFMPALIRFTRSSDLSSFFDAISGFSCLRPTAGFFTWPANRIILPGIRQSMSNETVLKISSLTKLYGDITAVDNISFEVPAGQIIGLLGPNGAGKSTTINMILSILEPTSGTIEIFGRNLSKHRKAISSHINFAAVYAHVPPNLTVEQNLYIFSLLYGVKHPRDRVATLLKEFELEEFAKSKSGLLSSGELSRLNLAKAIINNPRLLLLDEPTASLDPNVSQQIREMIKKLATESHMAVLWTSHNMKEIETVCDHVLFLSHGKILLSGNPRTLPAEYGKKDLDELFIAVAREPLSLQD